MWQGKGGHDAFPSELIPCPLKREDVSDYYSLSTVTKGQQADLRLYKQQADAYDSFLAKPPLTKIPRGNKSARANMRPLAVNTRAGRLRAVGDFLGFVWKFFHLHASMEHILDCQLVAKFMGFLQARGNAPQSIMFSATQLKLTVPFITSPHCPGTKGKLVQEHVQQVEQWYSNLCGKLRAMADSEARAKPTSHECTLWEAWQHAEAGLQKFMRAFQVWSPLHCMVGMGVGM